jgi:hypothetical protein
MVDVYRKVKSRHVSTPTLLSGLPPENMNLQRSPGSPLPSTFGGIIAECGSRTQDYPSAIPFYAPPPLSWGGRIFIYEDFLLVIDDINILKC